VVISIVVAIDYPMVRTGVRAALERDPGFVIVGEARSERSLVQTIEQSSPDVVLLDRELRGVDALAFLDRVRMRDASPAVVILSEDADPDHVQAAFARGAFGYVLKRIDPGDLPAAIRQAVDGTAYHARGLPAVDGAAARAAGLTPRELDVVRVVARGLSNSAAGKELWVTEQTVKFHLTNVYRKLGVDSRAAAVRWAAARGLV
jgi:DNA-binding NarL/FixJ family response regulator